MVSEKQNFSAVDPSFAIYGSFLLEASAGTGKTYAIENLYLRFLLEEEGSKASCKLEEILLLSFTKKAARELKNRVRENIRRRVDEEKDLKKRRLLLRAFYSFEKAEIHTIHSFCYRMLSTYAFASHFPLESQNFELDGTALEEKVFDCLRFLSFSKDYLAFQIEILLKSFSSVEKLVSSLAKELAEEKTLLVSLSFQEAKRSFCAALSSLQEMPQEFLRKSFSSFLKAHKKTTDRQSNLLEELKEALEEFLRQLGKKDAFDIEKLLRSFAKLSSVCVSSHLKVKIDPEALRFFPIWEEFLTKAKEPLNFLIQPNHLFLRLLSDCQQLLSKGREEEDFLSPDAILKTMEKALEQSSFLAAVRKRYRVALIDEFQDTDPLQWSIFSNIFSGESKHIYLIGDPKQSIYAFRSADIYTYLRASQWIGEEKRYSLSCNYRSESSLVDALNAFFLRAKDFLALPALKSFLPYPLVSSSGLVKPPSWQDERASLHFFTAEEKGISTSLPSVATEEEQLFPFIANEIIHLEKQGIKLDEIAILVRDRYQAFRLKQFLQNASIASSLDRANNLANSRSFLLFKLLLEAVYSPSDLAKLKLCLLSPFFALEAEKLAAMKTEQLLDFIKYFQEQKTLLELKGLYVFFDQFLQSSLKPGGESPLERLFKSEGGALLYQELLHLRNFFIRKEAELGSLKSFVENLKELKEEDRAALEMHSKSFSAVRIMTLHISKGLEFSIVFALALISRTSLKERMILERREEKSFFIPAEEGTEAYLKHCEELDAEKSRQVYVAMTRASLRLYVPILLAKKKSARFGTASPMELFLARAISRPSSYEDLYEKLLAIESESVESFLESLKKEAKISFSNSFLDKVLGRKKREDSPFPVFFTPKLKSSSSYSLQSFSTLSKTVHSRPHSKQSLEEVEQDLSIHAIAKGKESGILLHEIFEQLPHLDKVSERIQKSSLVSYQAAIEGQVELILQKRLFKDAFSLKELAPKYWMKEQEFFYQKSEQVLTGFIDLIIAHESKVYLIDWKSNYLGPSAACYSQEAMEEVMRESDYFLQEKIYREAVEKLLSLKKGWLFGGSLYCFLRGISPDSDTGFYYL